MQRYILLGHTGHGKSTLANRLSVEYGVEAHHDVENETCEWSEIILRRPLPISTDTGDLLLIFSNMLNPNRKHIDTVGISVIDTPGHEEYISEVVYPATMCSNEFIGVVCVSSITSEYEESINDGQLYKLIILSRLCAIKYFVICWTKCNKAVLDQDKKQHIVDFIGQRGGVVLHQLDIDALNGDGVKQLKDIIDTTKNPELSITKTRHTTVLCVPSGTRTNYTKPINCTVLILAEKYTGEQLIVKPGFTCRAYGVGCVRNAVITKIMECNREPVSDNNTDIIIQEETTIKCCMVFEDGITVLPVVLCLNNKFIGCIKEIRW